MTTRTAHLIPLLASLAITLLLLAGVRAGFNSATMAHSSTTRVAIH